MGLLLFYLPPLTQLEKVFLKKELARVVALTGAHFVVNFFTLYKLIHFVYVLNTLSIKKRLDLMGDFIVYLNNRIRRYS